MDFMHTTFHGRLQDGEYTIKVEKWKTITKNEQDYVEMSFKINNRSLLKNMFSNDMIFFMSHVREQLGRQYEDIVPAEFVNDLIKNKTDIKVWLQTKKITTLTGAEKTVQNWNFKKPEEIAKVPETAEEDI